MKILVLGAGSTGGYFGGRLAEAGADVTFLVRERRAQQLAQRGLQIESPAGNITLPVRTVLAANLKPEFDIIILACKAYDLESSIAAIKPAMGADTKPAMGANTNPAMDASIDTRTGTVIVPLLNGIAHLDALDAAFGAARVMGGTCQIAATLTPDGVVKSMADTHSITWGAREGLHKPQQQKIAEALGVAFANTTVAWKVSDHIMLDMWEKIAFLSTLAAMTCLMRANVGEILATPDGKNIMTRYVQTSMAIAAAEGYPPRAHVVERFEKILASQHSTLTASMLRDLENGHEVEADHIVGYMLNKAREHHIDDYLIAMAFTHLKAYQQRRLGKRLS